MTIPYYRQSDGRTPPDVHAQVAEYLRGIPVGQKVCITVMPAEPMHDLSAYERVCAVVEWYASLPTDFADIDTLANKSRVLACANADLAMLAGQLAKAENVAEFQRKAMFARSRQSLLDSQVAKSVAAAEAQVEADAEYLNLKKVEIEAAGDSQAARLLLSHASAVLDTMRQHISNLKTDRQNELAGRGSQNA